MTFKEIIDLEFENEINNNCGFNKIKYPVDFAFTERTELVYHDGIFYNMKA